MLSLCLALEILQEPHLKALTLRDQMPLAAERALLMWPSPRSLLETHLGPHQGGAGRWSCFGSHHPHTHHHSLAPTLGRTKRGAWLAGGTWNMLAPYGVLQALRRLSFPVLTNHLPAGERKRASGCDLLPPK